MSERRELVPLADRLVVLVLVRLGMAAIVVAGSLWLPHVVAPSIGSVLPLAAAYAALSVSIEVLRRATSIRGLGLLSATLLLDGVWIATVVTSTGGYQGPLAFLPYFHVVAVALVLTSRTGTKVAVWHALLLICAHVVATSGLVPDDLAAPLPSEREAGFGAFSLLLLALGAAGCSSMNEKALVRGRGELAAIARVGIELQRAARADEIFTCLLTELRGAFDVERAAVVTHRDGGWRGAVTAGAAVALVRCPDGPGGPAANVAALGWADAAPRLLRRLDAAADPLLDRLLPAAGNVAVVPLVVDGGTVGALAVEWRGRRAALHAQTVDALAQIAANTALSLRNAWLLAEVERLATFDGLTGLANRRSFEIALDREVERSRRTGQPLGLVVLDVDHFKAVNDHHGHQAGDDVLRAVGAALAGSVRSMDVAARYGGEEFAVLLPSCTGPEALQAAERLRAAIAAAEMPVSVTASAGVAVFPRNAADRTGLVAAADAALYESKQSGRDRSTASKRRHRLRAAAA